MPENILFLIRGKLGDSLVCFSVLKEYAARHPDQEVTAFVRRNYAEIFAGEGGIHVVPYKNRLQVYLHLIVHRLLRGRFDVFAVLVGYGDIVPKLARLSGARRKIYLDGRFADVLPEYPPALSMERQVDPPWQVASLLDPALPKPEALRMETLSALRRGKGVREGDRDRAPLGRKTAGHGRADARSPPRTPRRPPPRLLRSTSS